MNYNETTTDLLLKIKKTILDLETHLSAEELEAEAFLGDYTHIIDSASDQLMMALHMFPSKDLLENFTVKQMEEFISMMMSFRHVMTVIKNRLCELEDECINIAF